MLRTLSRESFLEKIKTYIQTSNTYKISITECLNCFYTIWPNAWRDGMVSASDYLCTQVGTVICSLFMTLPETGIYSVSYTNLKWKIDSYTHIHIDIVNHFAVHLNHCKSTILQYI